MTQHSTAFEIERPVPAGAAVGDLLQSKPAAQVPAKKFNLRKALFTGVALVALLGAAWYGWDYWTVGQYQVSTDDAYVKADNTTIAPKVSGYLHEVLVGDNERVRAGQTLARIDDRDFKVALDQAKADVAAAKAAISSKQAQLEVQEAVINAAKATIDVDDANVTFAAQDNKRYSALATSGYGSVQNAQLSQSKIASAEATRVRDTANLTSATKQVDLLKAEIVQAEATLARAQALQSQAELNLSYTTITAPIDGVVGNRTLRTGQYVQAGTQLMSVVPARGAYVIANYKETQLTDVHEGQAVEIAVDMFPGQIVRGHVDSLAPASGQEFALLPPDNATGNFTKVVQRIPVKIALDDGSNSPSALRPGMSVIPTIETRNPAPTRQVRGGSEASGASKAAGVPQAAGASKISNNVSANTSVNGACHVQSHPVSLDRSASDLFDRI